VGGVSYFAEKGIVSIISVYRAESNNMKYGSYGE